MKNIKYYFMLMTGMFLLSGFATAQNETNKTALNDFYTRSTADFNAKKAAAAEYAKDNNIPLFITTDNSYAELMYIDKAGQPQYLVTENANASKTSSTNKVNTGGVSGLNLDGEGMTVHEWDGGSVLSTHQEFGNRVTVVDNVNTHYHSTHVAGTIMASGVQAAAKGMAPKAKLRSRDWNNDAAEMAWEAANENALVSNHSYGYSRGWTWTGTSWAWYGDASISNDEDYRFGFYDANSKSYDQIAFDAPYYLIVKSAGNDRGDGPANGAHPQDGPYDCIGTVGVAKNILTVGAVNDIVNGYSVPADVVMSSFSSWGPADDGRIKPDIVANGVSLYSTYDDNNTAYNSISGTSMASPAVSGALILLQEHYHDLNNAYMRAATLKALVLHTADEAGPNVGPDYMFGWGLLNTLTAAQKISEDQQLNVMEELNLANNGNYQRVVIAKGGEPLKVTIVWTDVPGNPVAAALDPIDAMLINDLDLKLSKGSSNYYPWALNRNNPSNAATHNGENNVDNVEMVYIANPEANASYTITVDHDGSLSGGSQNYSIIISGIKEEAASAPVANFTESATSINVGETVTFTDQSTNSPTSWSWSFSGGTPSSSTSQNPVITYNTAGTYNVTLTATNAAGSNTKTKTALITVTQNVPVANFTESATSINVGETVTFTDQSTNSPTSWSWSFSGGTPSSSTSQNPTITYNTAGTYNVSLTATNVAGSNTKTKTALITVSEASVSYCSSKGNNYSYEWIAKTEIGAFTKSSGGSNYSDYTNETVQLTSGANVAIKLSPGFSGTTYDEFWKVWIDYNQDGDFTDSGEEVYSGNGTSAVSGSFNVSSSASGSTRMRISMKWDAVQTSCETFSYGEVEDYTVSFGAPVAPVAAFSAASTVVSEGESIQFTDESSNGPTSWSWTFEGGSPATSNAQNPSVTYSTSGTYTVTLVATNAGGSSTETKTDYITVNPAAISYCSSQGNNYSYEWISKVMVNSYTHNSSGSNYSDYTSEVITLNAGSNTINLTPAFSGRTYTEIWRVWVDWNKDGDFNDAGEEVFTPGGSNSSVSGSFNTPAGFSGQTRMRVSMKWNGTPTPCESFRYGEVEDYTINVAQNNFDSFMLPVTAEMNVYPNPADDYFYLDVESMIGSKLFVYDMKGRVIMEKEILDRQTEISTSGMESGVYLIRLIYQDQSLSKRLIVK